MLDIKHALLYTLNAYYTYHMYHWTYDIQHYHIATCANTVNYYMIVTLLHHVIRIGIVIYLIIRHSVVTNLWICVIC